MPQRNARRMPIAEAQHPVTELTDADRLRMAKVAIMHEAERSAELVKEFRNQVTNPSRATIIDFLHVVEWSTERAVVGAYITRCLLPLYNVASNPDVGIDELRMAIEHLIEKTTDHLTGVMRPWVSNSTSPVTNVMHQFEATALVQVLDTAKTTLALLNRGVHE